MSISVSEPGAENWRLTTGSVIVTLATAWGPKHGGINAFNTEVVKSLGILPTRHYQLVCVIPGRATEELREELRLRFHIELISLEEEDEFNPEAASEIARRLDVTNEPRLFIWIGHDDKSGPLAVQLKALAPGSHVVLINHMAHGAYQSVKKGSSQVAAEKRKLQLDLFRQADLCLTVGPMLRTHLRDLLASLPSRPPVEMLVPGLADPTEYEVDVQDSAPENFVGFIAGRLDKKDDRIKQGRLALRGFGKAVRDASGNSAIRRSPTLRMRGVRPAEEQTLLNLLMQEAGRAVNFDFQDYTDDRSAYFRDLTSASVAMMPSWHEGFGLTAWEAIASAVPVIISVESGVYRLLEGDYSGSGLGQSVAHVAVEGWIPGSSEEPNHTADDVVRVAEALLTIAQRMSGAKQQALTLRRNLLALGLDWKGTALSLTNFIEKYLGIPVSAERMAAVAAATGSHDPIDTTVPDWLRVPARRAWRPELQLPTSILLAARDEIVRFDSERQPFLQQMVDWAVGPGDLSARVLFGPGGMGKTRLALALAHQLQRDGWLIVWLASAPPKNWLESLNALLRTHAQQRVIVVIDYADARREDVLASLHQAFERLRAGAVHLRLLFVGRSKWWLAGLSKHPNCPQDLAAWLSTPSAIESLALPPWSEDYAARLASYRLALHDYAAVMGLVAPVNAYVPGLSGPAFDRPLYIHLAALAALEGQRPPSAEALLRDQLRREWHYWLSVHGECVARYDDWADALAFVILRQGVDIDRLQRALEKLNVDSPTLAAALQQSYPAENRIAALEPDLVAETLLRERLAERRGALLLDIVLGDDTEQLNLVLGVLGRLAARPRPFEPDQLTAWARVLIAEIACRWPSHPNEWLAAAHRAEYGLGEVLFQVWQQLDESVRTSLATSLDVPIYSANLLRLAVAVWRQRLQIAADPPSRATALLNLAGALSHLGDLASRTAALDCTRMAVGMFRELAEDQPSALLSLAASLMSLADRLSEQRDAALRTEELACAREAERIYRKLAENDPATYLAHLAMFLTTLAVRLSKQGDAVSRNEALVLLREAVGISRQLANLPQLAHSLFNLAESLSEQTDAALRAEALACAREAAVIYGQLADSEPTVSLPDLARSLNNLADRLSEQGDVAACTEALDCTREAVRIYRQLAKIQPAAHLPNLAWSLQRLAPRLRDQGAHSEELTVWREATRMYRQLADDQPATYLADLASSLANFAISLSEQSEKALYSETEACWREAIEIFRQVAQTQQTAYLPYLAKSLDAFATFLAEHGGTASRTEALVYAREAEQIYLNLATETAPAKHLIALALSLKNLADRLLEQDDPLSHTEALARAREAVQLYALFHGSSDAFERELIAAVETLNRAASTARKADNDIETPGDA